MEVVFVQFFLGVFLFFIINWIGKHSYSIGYMEISIFVKTEEAPALNFLIRVLSPIVYIIIISAILYYLKLDKYVYNLYIVNIYYIIFRLIFNIVTGRAKLLNYYRQMLYWFAIIVISYFTYENLIKFKTNILPDFTTIANELWIIIMVFIFQVTNNIRLSKDGTAKRKFEYLKFKYIYFKKKYGSEIEYITEGSILLEKVAYSIIIYENFNRPWLARLAENINQRLTNKPHTLGVMQVLSDKPISDLESVILGTKKIVEAHKKYQRELGEEDYNEYYALYEIIKDYNGGSSYNSQVSELVDIIGSNFYQEVRTTED